MDVEIRTNADGTADVFDMNSAVHFDNFFDVDMARFYCWEMGFTIFIEH